MIIDDFIVVSSIRAFSYSTAFVLDIKCHLLPLDLFMHPFVPAMPMQRLNSLFVMLTTLNRFSKITVTDERPAKPFEVDPLHKVLVPV